jgi:hypothetical protein
MATISNISLKSKKFVFDIINGFYDIAEEFVSLIDITENPVMKNSYIVAVDGLIEKLDRASRMISDEYIEILNNNKVSKKSSQKIVNALDEIKNTVYNVKENLLTINS